MEKGFLLLVGNYYDLVHYIKIEGIYYTLSRDHVEKIEDINNNVDFYIKPVTLTELEAARPVDPYYLKHPKLSNLELAMLMSDESYSPVKIKINRDQQDISQFQQLSVDNNFAYFEDVTSEPIVLLEYMHV